MTYATLKNKIPLLLLVILLLTLSSLSCRKKEPVTGSEYQKWQENNQAIASLFDISCEAFYGPFHRLPASIDELKSSGWLWFQPTVPDYAPGFEIIDREHGEWGDDRDKVRFSFTETGYICDYYVRKTGETEEHQKESIGTANVVSRYESHRSFDPDGSRYNILNVDYRRQFLAFNLARIFMRRYYTEHNGFPSRAADLYNAWCEPVRDAISAIPIIPAGNPYSVYIGFATGSDRGVMYLEIVRPDSSVFLHQRAFKIDAQGNAMTVIETTLPEEEQITKEDTVMFIDSSLRNWGM